MVTVEHQGKNDISVVKLLNYNLLFFVPLFLLYIISNYFSVILGSWLEISPKVTSQILMLILSMIMFFVVVPFIRVRETIKGVRFSFFNFIITGLVITIPSIINGDYTILLSTTIYLANFVFATFITSPDVIGISGDPEDWFKHKAQMFILMIYFAMIMLYITGFGWIYYQMGHDQTFTKPFDYTRPETLSYGTFFYYSFETMTMVGYGDILPISNGARVAVMLQTLLGVITNLIFIATLIMYVSYAQNSVSSRVEKKLEQEQKMIQQEEEEIMRREDQELREIERGVMPSDQRRAAVPRQGMVASSASRRMNTPYDFDERRQQ